MNLFHETENKYYEILSYLLSNDSKLTEAELSEFIHNNIAGERDFEVEDTLFQKDTDKGTVFKYEDGEFVKVINELFPIRNTQIESQAMKMLPESEYAKHFLNEDTIDKLKKATALITKVWNHNDISIKNQYRLGVSDSKVSYYKELSVIYEAIEKQKAIQYDNTVSGKFAYIDAKIFPVKVEYSLINDVFRVCAYEEKGNRFIKMNLSTMSNIRIQNISMEHLQKEYQDYLDANTKKLILDVEPVDHVVERCFRIFSFHERKAIYDKESRKYKLEIHYLKFDENEVIRDILSLGSSVIVIEPKRLQKEIYKRIIKAWDVYNI